MVTLQNPGRPAEFLSLSEPHSTNPADQGNGPQHRELDRLRRSLNHDIKSPLHAIQSLTGMFASDPASFSSEELNTMATEIHHSVQEMGKVLEGLLQWMEYLLQRNNALTRTHAQQEVQSAVRSLQSAAEQKGIDLEIQLPDQPVDILAMEGAAHRALGAVIENAIKFSPGGSKVVIIGTLVVNSSKETETLSSGPGASTAGDANTALGEKEPEERASGEASLFRVDILDEGPGLSEKVAGELLRLEKRIMATGSGGEKGAGVGLLMAHDAMIRSGGRLGWEMPDRGCHFYLEFRVAHQE